MKGDFQKELDSYVLRNIERRGPVLGSDRRRRETLRRGEQVAVAGEGDPQSLIAAVDPPVESVSTRRRGSSSNVVRFNISSRKMVGSSSSARTPVYDDIFAGEEGEEDESEEGDEDEEGNGHGYKVEVGLYADHPWNNMEDHRVHLSSRSVPARTFVEVDPLYWEWYQRISHRFIYDPALREQHDIVEDDVDVGPQLGLALAHQVAPMLQLTSGRDIMEYLIDHHDEMGDLCARLMGRGGGGRRDGRGRRGGGGRRGGRRGGRHDDSDTETD